MTLFRQFIENVRKPREDALGALIMNIGHNKRAIWCIDNHLKPAENYGILDIGSGGQNIANLLRPTKGRVCGMDYSPASVAGSLRKNRKAVEGKENELWMKTLDLRIYTPDEITAHMWQAGFQHAQLAP